MVLSAETETSVQSPLNHAETLEKKKWFLSHFSRDGAELDVQSQSRSPSFIQSFFSSCTFEPRSLCFLWEETVSFLTCHYFENQTLTSQRHLLSGILTRVPRQPLSRHLPGPFQTFSAPILSGRGWFSRR